MTVGICDHFSAERCRQRKLRVLIGAALLAFNWSMSIHLVAAGNDASIAGTEPPRGTLQRISAAGKGAYTAPEIHAWITIRYEYRPHGPSKHHDEHDTDYSIS